MFNDKKWIEEFSKKFYLINGGHCGKYDFEDVISFFTAKKKDWQKEVFQLFQDYADKNEDENVRVAVLKISEELKK